MNTIKERPTTQVLGMESKTQKNEVYVIEFRAFGKAHKAFGNKLLSQHDIEHSVWFICPTSEIISINIELVDNSELELMEDITETINWHNRIMNEFQEEVSHA